ncbi:MAG: YheC/YheD family protein [Quinella sp. 1Q5]|nr:YheC/YheD family protein [Quinella sp. 1Q5]
MKDELLTNILANDVHEVASNSFLNNNFFTDALANNLYETKSISKEANEPLRVGMLRLNNNLGNYTTANLMAYMARQFNIELYFFTTKDFNPEDKTVRATLIDGNTQIKKTIPLPKITYDINGGFYQKEVRTILGNETYFFQYGWGASKRIINNIMTKDERFKEFLIETHVSENFEHFMSLFKEYHNDVVLKPSNGSLGNDVVRIFSDGVGFTITLKKEQLLLNSVTELQAYYEENFVKRSYVLQPYIVSRTKYGNPFDIRIHTRRDSEGEFKIIPYPRIGRNPESILSNIAAGGYTMPLVKFLKEDFGKDWKIIHDKLIYLGNNIPALIQASFNKIIFAIGIDVGIQRCDNSYELKIFEINTYNPGILSIPIEAAFITLEYLQYLGKCLANGTFEKFINSK